MSKVTPTKRTVTLKFKLHEVAKALGYNWKPMNDWLDVDPIDVDGPSYSKQDIERMSPDLPAPYQDAWKLYPGVVATALREAEIEGFCDNLAKNRRQAVIDSLEKIAVVGEYIGITEDGQEMSVSIPSEIESVEFTEGDLFVTINNPEHLINDLINGMGYFHPHEIPVDSQLTDANLAKYFLSNIGDYFEIYEDRLSEPGEADFEITSSDALKYALEYAFDVADPQIDLDPIVGEDPEEYKDEIKKWFPKQNQNQVTTSGTPTTSKEIAKKIDKAYMTGQQRDWDIGSLDDVIEKHLDKDQKGSLAEIIGQMDEDLAKKLWVDFSVALHDITTKDIRDEIDNGDKVLFDNDEVLYVVDNDYGEKWFWVTDQRSERTNPDAEGWSIRKSEAIKILEKNDEE